MMNINLRSRKFSTTSINRTVDAWWVPEYGAPFRWKAGLILRTMRFPDGQFTGAVLCQNSKGRFFWAIKNPETNYVAMLNSEFKPRLDPYLGYMSHFVNPAHTRSPTEREIASIIPQRGPDGQICSGLYKELAVPNRYWMTHHANGRPNMEGDLMTWEELAKRNNWWAVTYGRAPGQWPGPSSKPWENDGPPVVSFSDDLGSPYNPGPNGGKGGTASPASERGRSTIGMVKPTGQIGYPVEEDEAGPSNSQKRVINKDKILILEIILSVGIIITFSWFLFIFPILPNINLFIL